MLTVSFPHMFSQGNYIKEMLEHDLAAQRKADKECDEDYPPTKRDIAERKRFEKAMRVLIDYYTIPEDEDGDFYEHWDHEHI